MLNGIIPCILKRVSIVSPLYTGFGSFVIITPQTPMTFLSQFIRPKELEMSEGGLCHPLLIL